MKQTEANGRALIRIAKVIGITVLTSSLAGCMWEPWGWDGHAAGAATASNFAPQFTSAASVSVPEGSATNIYTATAADPNGDTLSFSVAGGTDQALFSIDAASGALSFNAPPDFENPADSNSGNDYVVDLRVEDSSGGGATLTLTVDITNRNEAPVFTSTTSLTIPENSAVDYTAAAFDPDLDVLSFSIAGGVDQALFNINPATGLLTFNSPPDFEIPGDSDGQNDYVVELEADDGNGETSRLIVTISVTDVSQLEIVVSFPTPNANLGDLTDTMVTGNLVDLEDGIVEFDDLNFVDVNGQTAVQSPADPSRWSVQVPAAAPDDVFLILADSVGGGLNTASRAVENKALILRSDLVAIDTVNDRLFVGDSGGLGAVIAVDLTNDARTIVADANKGSGAQVLLPEASALDLGNDRVLIIDSILGAVISVDLSSGDRTLISDSGMGAGPSFVTPLSIALDVVNNRALVVDAGLEALMSVDLASGDRSVVSDVNLGIGPTLFFPTAVVFDAANDRALVADVVLEAIVSVDLASGDRTVLADVNTGAGLNFPVSMLHDQALDRVLVGDINVEALISIDLTTGAGTIVSDAATGTGPLLSFPRSLALDASRNRVFVVDISVGETLAVDLSSGDRTVFADNVTGTGPSLAGTTAVALHTASNRTLLTENSQDGAGLVWVDLGSSNRSVLSGAGTGTGPDFDVPTAMVLDVPNNQALVLDDTLDALVSVDLANGNRVVISDQNTGSGMSFAGPVSVALDSANNRALVADNGLDALVSTDLGTGNRIVISDAGTGTGPQISSPTSVVLDAGNNRALLLDADLDALVSIDLGNGNRSIIADMSTGTGPNFSDPISVALDATNNRALVADGLVPATLLWVDLASGDRSVLTDITGPGPILLNVQSVVLDDAHSRAFAVDAEIEALIVVELGTGQRAIASQ